MRQKYAERGRDFFVVERDERRGRSHIGLGVGQGLRKKNLVLTKRIASMQCHTYLRISLSLSSCGSSTTLIFIQLRQSLLKRSYCPGQCPRNRRSRRKSCAVRDGCLFFFFEETDADPEDRCRGAFACPRLGRPLGVDKADDRECQLREMAHGKADAVSLRRFEERWPRRTARNGIFADDLPPLTRHLPRRSKNFSVDKSPLHPVPACQPCVPWGQGPPGGRNCKLNGRFLRRSPRDHDGQVHSPEIPTYFETPTHSPETPTHSPRLQRTRHSPFFFRDLKMRCRGFSPSRRSPPAPVPGRTAAGGESTADSIMCTTAEPRRCGGFCVTDYARTYVLTVVELQQRMKHERTGVQPGWVDAKTGLSGAGNRSGRVLPRTNRSDPHHCPSQWLQSGRLRPHYTMPANPQNV